MVSTWTILAYIGVASVAFAAAFITLVPIGAAKLRNDSDYASALAMLSPEERAVLEVDAEWDARVAEYEALFPDVFSAADEERVAQIELRLAMLQEPTDAELWRMIEESA